MARLIARGGKEEGDFPTSEGKERKGDLYIIRTYGDSNNSRAISLPHLTHAHCTEMVLGFPLSNSRLPFRFYSISYTGGA